MEMWSQLAAATWLVPDLEEAVPRPSSHRHAVDCDAKAADAIVMPSQHS